jgi:hypothetical protein
MLPAAAVESVRANAPAWVVSADHYFTKPDGVYDWYAEGLHRAHTSCFNTFQEALRNRVDVVVDNTNLKHRMRRGYLEAAEKSRYQIQVIVLPLVPGRRNIHGVDDAHVQKMESGRDIEPGTYSWCSEFGYRRISD